MISAHQSSVFDQPLKSKKMLEKAKVLFFLAFSTVFSIENTIFLSEFKSKAWHEKFCSKIGGELGLKNDVIEFQSQSDKYAN